jgi:hypothetical protein
LARDDAVSAVSLPEKKPDMTSNPTMAALVNQKAVSRKGIARFLEKFGSN